MATAGTTTTKEEQRIRKTVLRLSSKSITFKSFAAATAFNSSRSTATATCLTFSDPSAATNSTSPTAYTATSVCSAQAQFDVRWRSANATEFNRRSTATTTTTTAVYNKFAFLPNFTLEHETFILAPSEEWLNN